MQPLVALLAAAVAAPAPGQSGIGPLPGSSVRQSPGRPPAAIGYSAPARGLQQGLVGSWPISSGLSAGIGMFPVIEELKRPPETRRNWTPMEVGRRTGRVAAVGLRLRF